MNFWNFPVDNIEIFFIYTGFVNVATGRVTMILVGTLFIFLDIRFRFEPLLLVPIGFGMLIGNIPFKDMGLQIGIYEEGSVLNIPYQGVEQGWYPLLIFLGIGVTTDFSVLILNPKLMLIGAAAQLGVFGAHMIALQLDFEPNAMSAIDIIGSADGPTAIFLPSKLVPNLLDAIAVSVYFYMALVPIIQPPFMRLLTADKKRCTRVKALRKMSRAERILFPISDLLLVGFFASPGLSLLGMLFFGDILKESGVCDRLARTAREPLIDIITILLGVIVGASTQATHFLTLDSMKMSMLDVLSLTIATCSGVLSVKVMNLFPKEGNKINSLIDNTGASAAPDSVRISQIEGTKYDRANYLLMYATSPNMTGAIDSAMAAGILLGFFS